MSTGRSFLQSLLLVSEKAANIARAIRYESHLLSLLIREKKEIEKNNRFEQDFKTLTDVLVQEVVKHDLGKEYPMLVKHICGEESNEFTTSDGEVLYLEVGETEEDTFRQLLKLLGDERPANLLAKLVHSSVDINSINTTEVPFTNGILPIEELSIWIDPIDSTAQYINGGCTKEGELFTEGLPCVTVLIGAFHRKTGLAVAGVINQPFLCEKDNKWTGQCIWGLSWQDEIISSVPQMKNSSTNTILISGSEKTEIKSQLESGGFKLVGAAGAGYKLMAVILGLVDAYVLSKGSTYFWDTCSSSAILKSVGGMIVDYRKAVDNDNIVEIIYKEVNGDECRNVGGIIAFRDSEVLNKVLELLKNNV